MIEIDRESGFCFGVVTAIRKAEEVLDKEGKLYCLGDIVHNSNEVERLCKKGLITITHEEFRELHDVKVLLRAHGEPPETYAVAKENNIEIIDATCPVVLQLQKRINHAHKEAKEKCLSGEKCPQIIIYGKRGHAEVNGLVGQTEGEAIVIEDENELAQVDLDGDIILYSQTTKSPDGFNGLIESVKSRKREGAFQYYDTICRQVASRREQLREFAASHKVILFVCGAKSSNGRVLFAECREVNPHTYMISNENDIDLDWLSGKEESIGICGATSTPGWLMERVKKYLEDKMSDGTAERQG